MAIFNAPKAVLSFVAQVERDGHKAALWAAMNHPDKGDWGNSKVFSFRGHRWSLSTITDFYWQKDLLEWWNGQEWVIVAEFGAYRDTYDQWSALDKREGVLVSNDEGEPPFLVWSSDQDFQRMVFEKRGVAGA